MQYYLMKVSNIESTAAAALTVKIRLRVTANADETSAVYTLYFICT